MTDYDPKIVALYDLMNPDGADHDYYRSLANRTDVHRILDLGCGTGILTVTLTVGNKEVFGVDPSPTMLAYARQRQYAENVSWVQGNSSVLEHGLFDLALLTGNVAQHIPDPHWAQTLADIRKNMPKGALLAFESRNPLQRAWESWNEQDPRSIDTPLGPLVEWNRTEELGESRVLLKTFTEFTRTGEHIQEELILTFRTQQQVCKGLHDAGFEVTTVWGDWNKTPFDGSQDIMIFEARAI